MAELAPDILLRAKMVPKTDELDTKSPKIETVRVLRQADLDIRGNCLYLTRHFVKEDTIDVEASIQFALNIGQLVQVASLGDEIAAFALPSV
jgi:hypothetical protein|tara:strand:- start:1489 stop:1764 length:276 start_codon:yes stop_codon:yes gene_type:complete